jgi:hypothetical protein
MLFVSKARPFLFQFSFAKFRRPEVADWTAGIAWTVA